MSDLSLGSTNDVILDLLDEDLRCTHEWLIYLSGFEPEAYVSAMHICPDALGSFRAKECRIIFDVNGPLWILQPVLDESLLGDASLADIFGNDCTGIVIKYCPFCGMKLPELLAVTHLTFMEESPSITMASYYRDLQERLNEERLTSDKGYSVPSFSG